MWSYMNAEMLHDFVSAIIVHEIAIYITVTNML